MTDKHLRESLRRLPEAGAGEGFTRAVLARLAEERAGAEDHAATPWPLRLRQRLGGFSLSLGSPGPRLAVAAAVMVVAATLALTLIPVLDRTGQPETVAESALGTDGSLDVEGAPAKRPGDPVAEPLGNTPGPEPRRASVADRSPTPPTARAHPDAVSDLAALPSTAADTPTDTGAVAVRDAVPDSPPGTVPAAPDARSAPDTAAPGAARSRTLDPEERRRAVERLRQLRREQERLRTRLAALTEAPAPTLVLGGDESLELVLDLSADAGFATGGAGYGARPASYRPEPEHRRYFH